MIYVFSSHISLPIHTIFFILFHLYFPLAYIEYMCSYILHMGILHAYEQTIDVMFKTLLAWSFFWSDLIGKERWQEKIGIDIRIKPEIRESFVTNCCDSSRATLNVTWGRNKLRIAFLFLNVTISVKVRCRYLHHSVKGKGESEHGMKVSYYETELLTRVIIGLSYRVIPSNTK